MASYNPGYEMGDGKRETGQIVFFSPELSNCADSFRQKSPITSTSALCSGSGLKEWVVITAEAKKRERRKMHK